MSLKRRLIFLNAAIVFIPIIITIAASFVFIFISSRVFDTDVSFENVRKITKINYELLKVDPSAFQEIGEDIKNNFPKYFWANLAQINAEVTIVKKDDIVFTTKSMNKIDLERCLEVEDNKLRGTVEFNGSVFVVKIIPTTFKDGKNGKTILLAPLGKEETTTTKFLFFTLIVYIISFLGANSLISVILSKSILKPVERLQLAAGEISLGNLNYEVIEEGDDEIKELCRAFETMRLKLKESVYTRIRYDENRKMLISNISHDLKTPITSIKGYVEGIIDGVANTPEKIENYLKTVYTKATHVDSMIDDLLLYSKLDLNQIPFNFEKTEVLKYFQDCILENEPELQKLNIEIRLQNELKKHIEIMLDRERFKRVVNNIIGNAQKYMNKCNGGIIITLRETKTSIIIEVQDNGSGIAKEDLPYIFDRFYRSDIIRTKMDGSGLGLAIAKQIVEGHEGKIWVKSREMEGTSIIISLKK